MKIGIIGGSVYAGVELLRLLATRDDIEIVFVSSRAQAGSAVCELFPSLRGHVDLKFSNPDNVAESGCDLVFFATPNGTAMKQAPALLEKSAKVVDLSADYRMKDIDVWEKWYGMTHESAQWIQGAVYGLPEMYRDQMRQAQLVANPSMCRLAVHQPQDRKTAAVLAIEDNLVKGAAGKAVQNVNLMLSFPEIKGLMQVAVMP